MKSAIDAAKLAGVSARRIRALCKAGRVKGAKLVGGTWVLPDVVKIKPAERRRPGKIKL